MFAFWRVNIKSHENYPLKYTPENLARKITSQIIGPIKLPPEDNPPPSKLPPYISKTVIVTSHYYYFKAFSQSAINCSQLTIETQEQGVEYVQS